MITLIGLLALVVLAHVIPAVLTILAVGYVYNQLSGGGSPPADNTRLTVYTPPGGWPKEEQISFLVRDLRRLRAKWHAFKASRN